jgi:glycosyltransferase involved in cell wall biosynthesis
MKVLMIGRNTLFSTPGGDTIQIKMTAAHLQKLGVSVDVQASGEPMKHNEYDLLHFFNIIRPDDILQYVTKGTTPFVVSTIFVDYSEYELNNRKGVQKVATRIFNADQLEYLKAIARYVKNGDKIRSTHYLLRGHRSSVKYLIEKASLLLPNSHSEYNRLVKKYGIEKPYRKIPNAIDTQIFNSEITANPDYSNHILCVGRIEGLKNQLNLIKSVADLNIPLTLIGKPAPNHMEYYHECKATAAKYKHIQIREHAGQNELAAIYKAAKVHVLPSWFETTGLSSLEAGVMGCNLVVTRKGDTQEYFEDMAYYCEPDNVSSIREAVLKAYDQPVKPELRETILTKYTWQVTASETLKAYQTVLNH